MKYLIIPIIVIFSSCSLFNNGEYLFNESGIQVTSYHIIYQSPESIDYHDSIKRILHKFDLNLSRIQLYRELTTMIKQDDREYLVNNNEYEHLAVLIH